MLTTCEECERPFNASRASARFCSRKCTGAWRGRHLQRREQRTCPVCGRTFEVGGRTGKRRDRTVTCSASCQRRSRYRHGARANRLKTADAAYLAGLIDGEGSIILYMRRDVVAMRVAVHNTYRPALEWVAETTGVGHVVAEGTPSSVRKAGWAWRCNADAAESLLRQVLPYLKIKPVQAALAIDTQERLRDPALKADRVWQAEYRERMKTLNRRGPAV